MSVLVIIPTYCERDSIGSVMRNVRASRPDADVLVVDDSSPDGTADIVRLQALRDGQVFLLERSSKDGLGRAYMAGFGWALERGYRIIVEMDADGSHRTDHLDAIISGLDEADLVIGSRWVPGGSTVGWSVFRQSISRAGNLYARLVLALPLRDATSGYRAFKADSLALCLPSEPSSQGYAFQVEMAWRLHRSGFRVLEVPIAFFEREAGMSKMTVAIAVEAAVRILQWRFQRRDVLRDLPSRPGQDTTEG